MNWRVLLIVAVFIVINILRSFDGDTPAPRRPLPEYEPPQTREQAPLPGPSIFDPEVYVRVDQHQVNSMGTAFALEERGLWLTARHVVDGCRAIRLRFPGNRVLDVRDVRQHPEADVALIRTRGVAVGLPVAPAELTLGQDGFFIGYPQGVAGEVWGSLMGRMRMRISGRYRTHEPVLAWAERVRRPSGLRRLAGLSGGPALDSAGRVVGVMVAESRRRGRVITAAPESIERLAPFNSRRRPGTPGITPATLTQRANNLRKGARVANVLCFAALRQYRSGRE